MFEELHFAFLCAKKKQVNWLIAQLNKSLLKKLNFNGLL